MGSGGDDKEGLDGGEDRGEGGAPIQESTMLLTPALRERGLIEQMEEEAREAGLGGWFNGEEQGNAFVESWSGPNSDVLASQDHVRTTTLTTIGRWTLSNLMKFPDLVVQDGVLILLMEGLIRPYQCLIYANQGSLPPYDVEPILLYSWRVGISWSR